MIDADYHLERELLDAGHIRIAFLDEVGRGALAGPLVVTAVTITADTDTNHPPLRDSKAVARQHHHRLADTAAAWVEHHVTAWVSARDIDRHGITAALRTAAIDCHHQLRALDAAPDLYVFDGPRPFARATDLDGTSVDAHVHLDSTSAACAAASLIAKHTRDTHMAALAQRHPGYGFERHAGYGTAEHQSAICAHGPSDEHRVTFCARLLHPQLALEL